MQIFFCALVFTRLATNQSENESSKRVANVAPSSMAPLSSPHPLSIWASTSLPTPTQRDARRQR